MFCQFTEFDNIETNRTSSVDTGTGITTASYGSFHYSITQISLGKSEVNTTNAAENAVNEKTGGCFHVSLLEEIVT